MAPVTGQYRLGTRHRSLGLCFDPTTTNQSETNDTLHSANILDSCNLPDDGISSAYGKHVIINHVLRGANLISALGFSSLSSSNIHIHLYIYIHFHFHFHFHIQSSILNIQSSIIFHSMFHSSHITKRRTRRSLAFSEDTVVADLCGARHMEYQ